MPQGREDITYSFIEMMSQINWEKIFLINNNEIILKYF